NDSHNSEGGPMRPQKVVLFLLLFFLGFAFVRFHPEKAPPKREGPVSLIKSWGHLPVSFVENHGQSDPRIRYSVLGSDKTLYFGPSGLTVSIHPKKDGVVGMKEAEAAIPGWNVKMEFVGANETGTVEGAEKAEATFNYFKGAK